MQELIELLSYDFFRKALLAAVLASISCGIIGTYIVSRRIVFISGGITHSSFGGIGLAFFLGLNPLLGAVIFAILSGLGIQYFVQKADVREDSSIAIWWSLGMAMGVIFIFLTPGYTPNLMSYLFGNILTVTNAELWMMLSLNIIILLFFFFFYRTVLYIAFDEEFAKASGIPVALFNYLLITLIALTVVLNIRVVGIILILSMLTIPQATANIFTKDFKMLIVLSTMFAFIGTTSGLLISYFANIPSGATIIFTLVIIFAGMRLINYLR
ncbi:Zinc ABC transporter, permease protein ZnuB [hydrothermal vent metagenome]|uniref:Zinc ABC transporter, permease protein ZnuB n=1 Tax=hydrothermal vent metagenome TaxID=652676 RepID=A0A3B0UC15_9ZZZZ